jgi:hypothetical protein
MTFHDVVIGQREETGRETARAGGGGGAAGAG